MPRPVPERINLPSLVRQGGEVPWARALVQSLLAVLQAFGRRLNGSVHQDGEVAMQGPFGLAVYLTADLPDAADYPGHVVFVSDAAAGAKFKGSDGTSWVALDATGGGGGGGITEYTVATRPDPATIEGQIIFVSDAAAGHRFQGSNGADYFALDSATAVDAKRYWRIHVTATQGTDLTQLQEVEMALTAAGADECNGGTATASSQQGSFLPSEAFDGDTTSTSGGSWASADNTKPQWLQYDFGVGLDKDIVEVRMLSKPAADGIPRCPLDFTIESSPDGVTWTVEKTVTGLNTWAIGVWQTVTIP